MRKSINQLTEIIDRSQKDGELVKQKVAQHENSIMTVSNSVNEIKRTLETTRQDTRDFIVASARSTIYSMYKECRETRYITKDAYFTLKKILDVYLRAGGNDIVHDHIQPYLMSLPIKDYSSDGQLIDYAPSQNNLIYKDRSDSDDV